VQLGITGFPKAGKTTLFNLLTSSEVATDKFVKSTEAHLGIAHVPDRRLEALRKLYKPKKFTPATIQYLDIPGVEKGHGAADLNLAKLKEVDGLVYVVRAFEDPELLHPEGSVDPARDVASFDLELIFADLELVERRLERLGQSKKHVLTDQESREETLLRNVIRPALEMEKPLRSLELGNDDEKRLRGFQLLSAKPLLLVANVAEDSLATTSADSLGLELGPATGGVFMSLPIEAEITHLPEEEQEEFLTELGFDQPSLDRAIQASYRLLGRISFFTVGEDEVRAWTIRRGAPARSAARAIHSDLERGFIRAEVVLWEDLVRMGSLAACRDGGTLRLEGKEYIVQDGEIVHVRFNV
jgi:GTP-binding protein YchF